MADITPIHHENDSVTRSFKIIVHMLRSACCPPTSQILRYISGEGDGAVGAGGGDGGVLAGREVVGGRKEGI